MGPRDGLDGCGNLAPTGIRPPDTSELEVTIWSGTFLNLRPVHKFSFKPPDGKPLAESCLEILPVIVGA